MNATHSFELSGGMEREGREGDRQLARADRTELRTESVLFVRLLVSGLGRFRLKGVVYLLTLLQVLKLEALLMMMMMMTF